MWARSFTLYSSAGNAGFTDGSQSMDRRTMRSLRLFRLTGRTEVRSQTRSPAIEITGLRAAAI